jgi:hypothetical protein
MLPSHPSAILLLLPCPALPCLASTFSIMALCRAICTESWLTSQLQWHRRHCMDSMLTADRRCCGFRHFFRTILGLTGLLLGMRASDITALGKSHMMTADG